MRFQLQQDHVTYQLDYTECISITSMSLDIVVLLASYTSHCAIACDSTSSFESPCGSAYCWKVSWNLRRLSPHTHTYASMRACVHSHRHMRSHTHTHTHKLNVQTNTKDTQSTGKVFEPLYWVNFAWCVHVSCYLQCAWVMVCLCVSCLSILRWLELKRSPAKRAWTID